MAASRVVRGHSNRVTDRLITRGKGARRLQLAPVRGWILALVMLTVLVVIAQLGPIAQDPAYHQFADARTLAGVPHALDVLSNLLFLVVGVVGLWFSLRMRAVYGEVLWIPYAVLYAGLILTGFGSAWYHLAPDNVSLVWDRLPMTIVFMSFFASVVAEVANREFAQRLLPVLLVVGVGSVLYWHATEQQGAGDLRPYVLVQFLPMLLIPLLLLLYPRPRDYLPWVLAMIGIYAGSKVFEYFDGAVFALGEIVSGHALKHLLAALSPACLLPMLWRRGMMRTRAIGRKRA
jgi:hypothetical protein